MRIFVRNIKIGNNLRIFVTDKFWKTPTTNILLQTLFPFYCQVTALSLENRIISDKTDLTFKILKNV